MGVNVKPSPESDPKPWDPATTPEPVLLRARRRAAVAAAAAGLLLLPWFVLVNALVSFDPSEPSLGSPVQDAVDFYAGNYSRIPIHVTLFVGQWVILLVLLVAVVRAAAARFDLASVVAVSLAGAATAVYVAAEGVLLWPALPAPDMDAERLRSALDPTVAQMSVLPRDGLHAVASILLGTSVIIIAWLLARSDLWGRWVMAVLGLGSGVLALTAALVGPEGLGPGLVFVLWAPVVAVLLLVGVWRTRRSAAPPAD